MTNSVVLEGLTVQILVLGTNRPIVGAIPPFWGGLLVGQGSDAGGGVVLTYGFEQYIGLSTTWPLCDKNSLILL